MNTEEPQNLEDCVQEPQCDNLRDELIRLSAAKEIKYSEKYIKKASQSTLEKIKQDHQRYQMEKVNSQLTENLITKFSDLMEQLNMVKKDGTLDKELSSNKLLYDDVKTLVMKVSPFIPMIGLLSGGLIVAKHMWYSPSKNPQQDNSNNKDESEVQNYQSSSTSDDSVDTSNPDNGGADTS